MSTSIVVVTHRWHRWLDPCLVSALAETDEVVLVDNGSSGPAVSEAGKRLGVRLLRSGRNLGFAGGVNAGLRAAAGDVIALLNDDAAADVGWLASAADVLADPSVAVVAPKILFALPHAEIRFDDEPCFAPGDPRPLGRCLYEVTLEGRDVLGSLVGPGVHQLESGVQLGKFVHWRWTAGRAPIFVPLPDNADPSTLRVQGEPAPVTGLRTVVNNAGSYLSAEGHGGDYGFGAADDGLFDEPRDRFAACGAAMVLRRDTLERLGPLAGHFFAYYEDLDWCWRAQLAGMRVRYDPRGVVRHVGGVTSGGPYEARVRFLAARNRILTLARNAPAPALTHQFRRVWTENGDRALHRSLAKRTPQALVQRLALARRWRRRPVDVWEAWAGVGETWPPPRE